MALLDVSGLVKWYGSRKVVDGVSFSVDAGEIVGLLGPNGAGKTTSFRMTTGQIAPYEGQVIFNGQDVTEMPMYRRARAGMGYLSQEQSIFRKLTVEKNILAILEALPRSRSLGRKLRSSERWQRTNEMLERFKLTHVRHTIAARASGGEKRRLEIARCLACEPLLILLDEPFAAVDPKTKEEIRRNIKELADSGIGILLTDHDVREVLKITTRSYLIVEGKVVAQGSPSELIRNQIAVDAYLGTTFTDNTLGGIPQIYSGTELPKTTTVPPQNAPIQLQQPVHLDTPVALPSVQTIPITQELNPLVVSSAPVLSEDRIRQRIEELRFQETAPAAELDLLQMGRVVIPWLLAAMERHEMILRDRAFYVLQKIVDARLIFEPYAPEVDRRHQVNLIRRQLERRAG